MQGTQQQGNRSLPPHRAGAAPPRPTAFGPPPRHQQHTVSRAKRAVPYALLGENTLVLSDLLCVRPTPGSRGAQMELVCR